jgi:hypothetical protein
MFSRDTIHQRGAGAHESFRISTDNRGHWCARKNDGMVAGTFFSHDAAIRFARRECSYGLAPKRDAAHETGVALGQPSVPTSAKVRRVALLAQLAVVAILLFGRVAAGVVDASVAPSFDPATVAGSSN